MQRIKAYTMPIAVIAVIANIANRYSRPDVRQHGFGFASRLPRLLEIRIRGRSTGLISQRALPVDQLGGGFERGHLPIGQ